MSTPLPVELTGHSSEPRETCERAATEADTAAPVA